MLGFVQDLLRRQAAGADLPFAVIEMALDGHRLHAFHGYPTHNRGVEIGGTWYGLSLPAHVCEHEVPGSFCCCAAHVRGLRGCIRVQLKTDLRNERSQRAIERIGGVLEGILRNHMIRPDGTPRDSVYYSIINHEWPAVKARLEEMLTLKNRTQMTQRNAD